MKKFLGIFGISFLVLVFSVVYLIKTEEKKQEVLASLKTETVYGDSMYPTIKEGDQVYVDLEVNTKEIKAKDIVTFNLKTRSENFVKRVIAKGGDKVEFMDNGEIFVNNQKLQEDYLLSKNQFYLTPTFKNLLKQLEYYKNIIPKDMVLLMGDNRAKSLDSSSFGLVPAEYIYGKVYLKD
jgi:signal peptidase I